MFVVKVLGLLEKFWLCWIRFGFVGFVGKGLGLLKKGGGWGERGGVCGGGEGGGGKGGGRMGKGGEGGEGGGGGGEEGEGGGRGGEEGRGGVGEEEERVWKWG